MATLLHIDSSAAGSASVSRSVADLIRQEWRGDVIYRDLGSEPVPPITADHVTARNMDPGELSAELKDATALQDRLIDEFLRADAYLFAVPMYNYSVPAAFKAWIDQIIVMGRTLPLPGTTAPTAGRPAIVVSARGGFGYGAGGPSQERDFVLPWLQLILGDTLGLALRAITPEGTLAPVIPAYASMIPTYEESLQDAEERARHEARSLTERVRSASPRVATHGLRVDDEANLFFGQDFGEVSGPRRVIEVPVAGGEATG
jgi:FMN-dependent NADH-azoreductase